MGPTPWEKIAMKSHEHSNELPKNVQLKKLVPTSLMKGHGAKDTRLLLTYLVEARKYLLSHHWCGTIEKEYYGFGIGGIIAIFLFAIRPTQPHVDRWLWVFVGDVPSVFCVTDDAPTPAEALETYIELMTDWVNTVMTGGDLETVYPVEAPPTLENARDLERRLSFLSNKILPDIRRKQRC